MSVTTQTAVKRRYPRATVEPIADDLITWLAPACARIEIAGSLRRRRETVADIEIVALPHPELDLFGQHTIEENDLERLVKRLLKSQVLAPRLDKNGRSSIGPLSKRLLYRGMSVDLFSARASDQFGWTFLLRTGNDTFTTKMVTQRRHGGWLPDWLRPEDGYLRDSATGEIVPTPTEEAVFAAYRMPFVAPERRSL